MVGLFLHLELYWDGNRGSKQMSDFSTLHFYTTRHTRNCVCLKRPGLARKQQHRAKICVECVPLCTLSYHLAKTDGEVKHHDAWDDEEIEQRPNENIRPLKPHVPAQLHRVRPNEPNS